MKESAVRGGRDGQQEHGTARLALPMLRAKRPVRQFVRR